MQADVTERDLAKEAHRLTADLAQARPAVYWADLALTVMATYAGLALAVGQGGALRVGGAVLCVFALYRAVSFIHELTHLRPADVPGFNLMWNAFVGVPFLAPSLLYEGVHNLHHGKPRYGTADDPEYLPLSRSPPLDMALFVVIALLAPLGAFLRFAIGTPMSLLIPRLRPVVVARFSAMTINPAFRREDIEAARTPAWLAQEIACWLWSWSLLALVVAGGLGARAVLTGFGLMSIVTLVNQLRTLVAHAWDGSGERMTFTDQFRDSINVPPPGVLPLLWAPVGLRYHALHHLLPRLPYHSLAEAHRRLANQLPQGSTYHEASHRGLWHAVGRLLERSRGHRLAAQVRPRT